jgi:hypothetical protein
VSGSRPPRPSDDRPTRLADGGPRARRSSEHGPAGRRDPRRRRQRSPSPRAPASTASPASCSHRLPATSSPSSRTDKPPPSPREPRLPRRRRKLTDRGAGSESAEQRRRPERCVRARSYTYDNAHQTHDRFEAARATRGDTVLPAPQGRQSAVTNLVRENEHRRRPGRTIGFPCRGPIELRCPAARRARGERRAGRADATPDSGAGEHGARPRLCPP